MIPNQDNLSATLPLGDWYAVQVACSSEERLANNLECKGYTTYVPLQLARKRYSDRVKTVRIPYYPGYLFCRCQLGSLLPVRITPGVIAVVSSAGQPCRIPPDELESIRLLAASTESVTAVDRLLCGRKVEVVSGPLKGVRGSVVSAASGEMLAVSITLLNRSLTVQLDRFDLEVGP